MLSIEWQKLSHKMHAHTLGRIRKKSKKQESIRKYALVEIGQEIFWPTKAGTRDSVSNDPHRTRVNRVGLALKKSWLWVCGAFRHHWAEFDWRWWGRRFVTWAATWNSRASFVALFLRKTISKEVWQNWACLWGTPRRSCQITNEIWRVFSVDFLGAH